MTPKEFNAEMMRSLAPTLARETLSVLRAGGLYRTRQLTWRERLLSWPWRPWVMTRIEFAPQFAEGKTMITIRKPQNFEPQ